MSVYVSVVVEDWVASIFFSFACIDGSVNFVEESH